MPDASQNIQSPKAFSDLVGFLSFVSSIVGGIATIYEKTNDIYESAQEAWPILGPLTFYVGIAAFMTFFFTFFIFRPIINLVISDTSIRMRALQSVVTIFGMIELFFALREGGYNSEESQDIQIIAQVIGSIVLLIGCFAVYKYIKQRGTIPIT